jgi:hypothetical protein
MCVNARCWSLSPFSLYVKGVFIGYCRAHRNQYTNRHLLAIDGVKSTADTTFYLVSAQRRQRQHTSQTAAATQQHLSATELASSKGDRVERENERERPKGR